MINNQTNNKRDIHERIYKFVLMVIELTKTLPKNSANDVVIHQIIKSSTSMGANDQEADGAQSKKETNYWLKIIEDTNPNVSSRIFEIQNEGIELVKII